MADSDSENEGILNNIQHLVIRPPGHTGKAKKGHICFDGGHETMNLGRVDFITNQEYDLYVRPDTANPRSRFWFHFTVENTRADQRVILNVVNLSKNRSLFSSGLTPVVKSTSRPRWQRMPVNSVFHYRSPLHSDNYVLSFIFAFDKEDERYSFALAQPYSMTRLNTYLEEGLLAKGNQGNFLRVETIGHTLLGHPLHLLTITDPANLQVPFSGPEVREKGQDPPPPGKATQCIRPKVIVIMARNRASESPTSFVVQGLIDFLVSDHEVARSLRRHLVFKIVPMVNPDGVFLGNTKGNKLGQDLNRCWLKPNKLTQPTIVAIKSLIVGLDSDPHLDLDLVLDIHSHPCLLGLFTVGNAYDDVYRFERHAVFPKILSKICPDYNPENSIYNNDEDKSSTARRFFRDALSPEVNTYTVEVSLLGFIPRKVNVNGPGSGSTICSTGSGDADPVPGAFDESGEPLAKISSSAGALSVKAQETDIVHYTDELYCQVGKNLARAMWDLYKILNVIPIDHGPGHTGSSHFRSFGLLRLQEIERQRLELALLEDGCQLELDGTDLPDGSRKWIPPNIYDLLENYEAAAASKIPFPMSVKTVVYREDQNQQRLEAAIDILEQREAFHGSIDRGSSGLGSGDSFEEVKGGSNLSSRGQSTLGVDIEDLEDLEVSVGHHHLRPSSSNSKQPLAESDYDRTWSPSSSSFAAPEENGGGQVKSIIMVQESEVGGLLMLGPANYKTPSELGSYIRVNQKPMDVKPSKAGGMLVTGGSFYPGEMRVLLTPTSQGHPVTSFGLGEVNPLREGPPPDNQSRPTSRGGTLSAPRGGGTAPAVSVLRKNFAHLRSKTWVEKPEVLTDTMVVCGLNPSVVDLIRGGSAAGSPLGWDVVEEEGPDMPHRIVPALPVPTQGRRKVGGGGYAGPSAYMQSPSPRRQPPIVQPSILDTSVTALCPCITPIHRANDPSCHWRRSKAGKSSPRSEP